MPETIGAGHCPCLDGVIYLKGASMLTFFELCGADDAVRFSPFAWRIKLMLEHKGAPYQSRTITFADKSALEPSGLSTVPVIRDGDTWISESQRIALWLEERFPDNPLFEGPAAIAQAPIINNWIDRNIIAPVFPMIVADIFDALDDENQASFRASREPRLGGRKIEDMRDGRDALRDAYKANLAPVEAILDNHKFLSGTAPAFADYCMMGSLMWPHIVTDFDPVAISEPVMAWRERMFDLFGGFARNAPRAV